MGFGAIIVLTWITLYTVYGVYVYIPMTCRLPAQNRVIGILKNNFAVP